ncbi:hypothetical protein Tbd_1572 [Thiobacillus denitrificans ATCC 25259]|uniref:Uncharacterized protein n=1 Tax=Thiobacillus denitrificans (strain ATCC 25259 / T1) TaxID=292415 RepID=Q3SIK3_THIDA|nr:hypothetical protein Tbd_1572 [Thiobacillus denitrificans ATCC 25259]
MTAALTAYAKKTVAAAPGIHIRFCTEPSCPFATGFGLACDSGASRVWPAIGCFGIAFAIQVVTHHKRYLRMMTHIQGWSAAFDYGASLKDLTAALEGCNAFKEDVRAYKLLFPA